MNIKKEHFTIVTAHLDAKDVEQILLDHVTRESGFSKTPKSVCTVAIQEDLSATISLSTDLEAR